MSIFRTQGLETVETCPAMSVARAVSWWDPAARWASKVHAPSGPMPAAPRSWAPSRISTNTGPVLSDTVPVRVAAVGP